MTVQQSDAAEIMIPAAYIEDVRSAVVAEIVSDSDMLRTTIRTCSTVAPVMTPRIERLRPARFVAT